MTEPRSREEIRREVAERCKAAGEHAKFLETARRLVDDCIRAGGDVEALRIAIGMENRWNTDYLDGEAVWFRHGAEDGDGGGE